MCNRYFPQRRAELEREWALQALKDWGVGIGPWGQGPFIRLKAGRPELVVGQWALIGDQDTRADSRPRMTNNARYETVDRLKTFRGPWARGQRCIVPAVAYDEPNWESGRNVWWRLQRADGRPWHLAGLWNAWTDPTTGEIVDSYTLLTVNCDGHPLLSRLHKPDPDRPPDDQDKRALVPLAQQDLQTWLAGNEADARRLIRLPDESTYSAGPAPVEAVVKPEPVKRAPRRKVLADAPVTPSLFEGADHAE